jgi:hypothetical protein
MTTDDKPQDTGASASAETGSREPGLASRPGPTGFDPARIDSADYTHAFYGILNRQGQFWTPVAFNSVPARPYRTTLIS